MRDIWQDYRIDKRRFIGVWIGAVLALALGNSGRALAEPLPPTSYSSFKIIVTSENPVVSEGAPLDAQRQVLGFATEPIPVDSPAKLRLIMSIDPINGLWSQEDSGGFILASKDVNEQG